MAQTATQVAKLVATDMAEEDNFGFSVAVSGDTAVVGAYFDDDAGSNSGSAYVFVRNPSDGIWIQQAKLTAMDAAADDNFGSSVSVSGDTAVIGSFGNDDAGSTSGSAYVFTRSGSTWTQQAKLTAADASTGDHFGFSVAVSGDTAVVGARFDDVRATNSGSAYIFTRSGSTWTQQAKLTAADAASADLFGISVSVSGDTAVVGANRDDDAGSNSGSAYVFSLTPPNTPPVAEAGPDQTVECTSPSGASVTLNGSGSTDPDGDPIVSYTWTGPFGMATGVSPTVIMPMNTSPTIANVTLEVSDDTETDTDDVFITVQDTTPPAVTAKLVPVKLKRKKGCFRVEFSSTDICDTDPTIVALLNDVSVTNGQLVELKHKKKFKVNTSDDGSSDDRRKKLKKHHGDDGSSDDESSDDKSSGACGDIKLAGPSFTLEVTAIDDSGNFGTGSDTFVFPSKHGDDGSNDDKKLKKKLKNVLKKKWRKRYSDNDTGNGRRKWRDWRK